MPTVFSHIVSNRLSQEFENIATESLSFILQNSEPARNGIMKLLHGIVPDLPDLHFRTQKTEKFNKKLIRPDMLGYHERETRVYIENKFEAGLTDNQPQSYLMQLAKVNQPSVLLVVVPEIRENTMWDELKRRLKSTDISFVEWNSNSGGIVYSIKTEMGPIMALTSWTRLLSALENEISDDPSARSDLIQLRALCQAAARDAFIPFSPAFFSEQRIPALILQLNSIVISSVERAIMEGCLDLKGVLPKANWERIGRYINFSNKVRVGCWFGIDFSYWKKFGRTPLWLIFPNSEFGRAQEVWPLLEPQGDKEGIFTKFVGNEFIIGIDVLFGEEKDHVVRYIVQRLKYVATILEMLPSSNN